MQIRRARLTDLDRLGPLFEGYLGFYEVESRDGSRDYLSAHLTAGTATVLLAEDGVEAVGFALLYPTWESLGRSRRWILYDLYVSPGARRRGVGRALVDACIELARDSGAGSLSLDTARDNHAAQALYEAAGFERDDVFVAYHHDLT